ncbi:MAG: cell division protein SepF [Salinarchaeum sp.]
MGLMNKILGDQGSGEMDDYADLEGTVPESSDAEASMNVRIAEISEKQDAIAIKDAVYDGDLVVADITTLRTEGPTTDHIVDELRRVAEEVGGDIVKKGDDQLIVTPAGVKISREKLSF